MKHEYTFSEKLKGEWGFKLIIKNQARTRYEFERNIEVTVGNTYAPPTQICLSNFSVQMLLKLQMLLILHMLEMVQMFHMFLMLQMLQMLQMLLMLQVLQSDEHFLIVIILLLPNCLMSVFKKRSQTTRRTNLRRKSEHNSKTLHLGNCSDLYACTFVVMFV